MAAERVQRRLAAILVADVVGYSRLMEADEEGTRVRLRSLHSELIDPRIAADGGRIVKTTGDGILVEFPSAVDAVRNALAIQTAMPGRDANLPEDRRIVFRVGINVGDVIIEGDDIHGDGVNVAARLEAMCEPGSVYISGSVFEQVTGKLDAAFDDLGEQKVKNISRPVRVFRVEPVGEPAGADAGTAEILPLPDKPSIAVLAFENMSGDPEQEYFADGIAEDIITALSRFNWFFVIARNSSFSYKGTSTDVRKVAKELGVKYVLEGSVRKGGNRVRITAQLIDAETGRHIWAERYDRDLEDIFAVQDEITEAITGATAPALVSSEERRASGKAMENLDVWDMTMRGNWHLWRLSRENFAEAQRLFEEAIAIDPKSTVAQIGLAVAYLLEARTGWAADIDKSLEIATKAAQKAVAIDDQDAMAHAALALAFHISLDNHSAVEECRQAVKLNPNLAFAEGLLGLLQAHLGDYEDANRHLDIAVRLSPRDQTLPFTNLGRVISSLVAERYDEYLERTRAFTRVAPKFIVGWRHLAAAYAILGRMDEARVTVEQVLKLSPKDSFDVVRKAVPIVDAKARAKYMDALLEAGLPAQ